MEAAVAPGNGLAYEERGAGSPVVFIHGLTFSSATWRPLLDRLADRFRCLAVDLPGHGGSAGLPQSMEEVGRQVYGLVSGLGIERPVMVGHSWGGALASMYAATFPVAGVVNVDQPLDIEPFIRLLQQVEPAGRGTGGGAPQQGSRLGCDSRPKSRWPTGCWGGRSRPGCPPAG